jgi:hypothetical protein
LFGISYDTGFAYEIDAKLSETIKHLSKNLILFPTVDRFNVFSFTIVTSFTYRLIICQVLLTHNFKQHRHITYCRLQMAD